MRPRNYSVLSVVQAGAEAGLNAGAELEFLQELEDAIQALGSSRFTVDGRPAIVAAETRARLGAAIKELTEAQISTIADGAEKFGKKDQRVLLEVVQGDAVRHDAQLAFPENNVTAQYIYYNEEQKEDARLLQELKRIQYLQNVVMKQLEMTDRSGSTQVVQGMIASGQKFVAGLTAVFKQVETLSKQIERGLQNKADMPTAEQKTAAIASITQALRALPAIDPRHIAVKNMVMQQVERLQARFNVTPTAPRQSATILQMKAPQQNVAVDAKAAPVVKNQPAAPVAKTDAKPVVQAQAKGEVKATPIAPVAKAEAVARVDVKGAAPIATTQTKAGVTPPSAPSETMRQMSATITAIAPNVSAQQTAARVGNTSPAIALQQTLAKALGITPAVATPVSAAPITAAPVVAAPASAMPVQVARNVVASAPIAAPIAAINNTAPVSVAAVAPVQSVAVQSAPVAVQVQVAQAPAQHIQAVQTQQQPQQAQQQIIAKQEPVKAVEPSVQPINQPQQPIVTTQLVAQPAVQPATQPAQPVQVVTAQPISSVQHTASVTRAQTSGIATVTQGTVQAPAQPNGSGQPAGYSPVTAPAQNNTAYNVTTVSQQSGTQGQTGHTTVDTTTTSRNGNTNAHANGTAQQSRGTAEGADNKGLATGEAVNNTTPAEAKKSDAAVEKNPERPNSGERGQEAKGEKEADKKKDVAADSGCKDCATKNCGACRVSSLQGNGSATVQYGNTNAQAEKEAKAKITENAAKCAGCGGCGPGGCSRVAADPNVVAAATSAALDKLGTRRRAAPALTPAAAA